MFGHFLSGAPDHDGCSIVMDFHQALVTCLHGTMSTPYMANEAGVKTLFGVIEMTGLTPPKYRRHQFTDELVGRAITLELLAGPHVDAPLFHAAFAVVDHLPRRTARAALEWSGPAAYVKIRDELYFAYWLEEACNGTLGTILSTCARCTTAASAITAALTV